MPDRDDDSEMSWVEARRLIISQLRSTDNKLVLLTDKIEQMQDRWRERDRVFNVEVVGRISDLNTRISMLELRAKMWGGAIGFLGGSLASALIDVIIGKLTK